MTIDEAWTQYREWLRQNATAAFENLGDPALPEQVAEVERVIGQALPASVRHLLLLNDGQRTAQACCVLPGLLFLSCQRIVKEWEMWASLRESEGPRNLESLDDACNSLDSGVLDVYTHPGWVPLFQDDDRSDYLGIDLAPTTDGISGQIINFGRDENDHFVAFPQIDELVAFWLDEARAGRVTVMPAGTKRRGYDWLAHSGGNSIGVLLDRRGS